MMQVEVRVSEVMKERKKKIKAIAVKDGGERR